AERDRSVGVSARDATRRGLRADEGYARAMARTFLLLGSGEFEAWSSDVERRALELATGDGSVVIVPTASAKDGDAVFERWAAMGLEHYAATGVPAEVLPVKTPQDAAREDLAARAERASIVYFSG